MRILQHPEPHHLRSLYEEARPEDRMEWEVALAMDLHSALREAIAVPGSRHRMLTLDDDTPFAMWGCHPLPAMAGVGQVWFIASTRATAHVHKIHSLWRQEMDAMHSLFPTLMCFTHPSNGLHHTWLARRKFRFLCHTDVGPNQARYLIYFIRRDLCADQPLPS